MNDDGVLVNVVSRLGGREAIPAHHTSASQVPPIWGACEIRGTSPAFLAESVPYLWWTEAEEQAAGDEYGLIFTQATCVRMITWMLSSCAGLFSSGCQVAASNSRVSLRYLACTRKERWHLLRRGLMHVFGIGGKNCCNSWHISRDRYGAFLLQTICKSNYKWMVGFSEADIWFKTLLWWRWDEVIFGLWWQLDSVWCNRPHGDPLVSKYRIYGFAFTRCCFFFFPFCFPRITKTFIVIALP